MPRIGRSLPAKRGVGRAAIQLALAKLCALSAVPALATLIRAGAERARSSRVRGEHGALASRGAGPGAPVSFRHSWAEATNGFPT